MNNCICKYKMNESQIEYINEKFELLTPLLTTKNKISILKNCYIIKSCECEYYLNEEEIICIDYKFNLLKEILSIRRKRELLLQWGNKNKHFKTINFDYEILIILV